MSSNKNSRLRIDQLLVERGLVESREKAKRLIMAGQVRVNGQRLDKPAVQVPMSAKISLVQPDPYVSRGAYKLIGALDHFKLEVEGLVACDVGSSTGGFTQVLLERGAKRVYCIDVGKGQLHWKLRNDPRVRILEGVNARYLTPEMLEEAADLCTIDVSFISLKLILPAVKRILKPKGKILALVKPQFEAGRKDVKKGLVLKPDVHVTLLKSMIEYFLSHGLNCEGLTFSPIRGAKGNIEYFALLSIGSRKHASNLNVESIVNTAFERLWR
ncbi:MAG: TlyA family RNA methyltransferase [Thermotogae bacterium]|nr:TlyA family RNA methyltransferase [Thermotogota bacterium]